MANNQRPRAAPRPEKNVSESEGGGESVCVVCFKPIVYFAIGECDHLCCYECSTRIRVLCRQNDCPICRRDLSKVIFSKVLLPYQQLETKNRSGLYDKKYRICFTEVEVQQAFFDLLDNKCPRCDEKNFPKFELLREHVRKRHEMFYCDICTEHLKVFSSERRCYNRQELALHRRKGDPDKVGHRGHPLCEYCDTRFLDKDELFRHLRKDHFFCHYCDADGRNYFYGDYASLRKHFQSDHFLCEEGECEQEQFTSVFRSEIDLRAHRATAHGKAMNREANKQTRRLELEFSYAPRHGLGPGGANAGPGGGDRGEGSGGRGGGGGGGRSRGGGRGGGGRDGGRVDVGPPSMTNYDTQREFDIGGPPDSTTHHPHHPQTIQQHPKRVIDATSEQDFPSLGGTAPNPVFRPSNLSIRQRVYGAAGLARTKENFPALGSEGGESTGPTSLNEGFSSKITASSLLKPSQPSSGSRGVASVVSGGGGGGGGGGTSMMIHVSNRPPTASASGSKANGTAGGKRMQTADFPALPGSSRQPAGSSSATGRKLVDPFADPDDRTAGSGMVNLNAMSAKHRALADDYVSVSSVVSKVNTIAPKDAQAGAAAKKGQVVVPSVNSTKAFPSLGDATGVPAAGTKPVSWVASASIATSSGGQPSSSFSVSSKKKPAPAPNLKDDSSSSSSGGGFVNLNALTGKKSGDSKSNSKQKATATTNATSKVADARNNNNYGSQSAATTESAAKGGATKDRSKEASKQPTKSNGGQPGPGGGSNQSNSSSSSTNNNNNNNYINNQPNGNASKRIAGTTGDTTPGFGGESFPALGNNGPVEFALAAGPKRTPPGFENVHVKRIPGPPPGFGHPVTLNSVARNTNNMTFTNSNGESYNILPSYSYAPLSNAYRRNQSLDTVFQKSLKNSTAYNEFKRMSQMFLDGQYNGAAYYEQCKCALGDRFNDTFPELIALLPNIAKQQELYLVYCQDEKNRPRPATGKGKGAGSSANRVLEVCQVCKQVLISAELTEHAQTHYLENNFPKLGRNGNDEAKLGSAWKK
ncbi:E3 ubiquitin-protein ligase ZNF598-like [Anopheles albimanus]|uniref:E3 ubiquitin-protein ligase ZNF598-like n=1 Tax=Anopheles albimanus TaxID=7167 RepID=UPI00163E9D8A|nr:E3 ubiquitin-protein ligase ZNF598-like [Anopheles albimanus]